MRSKELDILDKRLCRNNAGKIALDEAGKKRGRNKAENITLKK